MNEKELTLDEVDLEFKRRVIGFLAFPWVLVKGCLVSRSGGRFCLWTSSLLRAMKAMECSCVAKIFGINLNVILYQISAWYGTEPKVLLLLAHLSMPVHVASQLPLYCSLRIVEELVLLLYLALSAHLSMPVHVCLVAHDQHWKLVAVLHPQHLVGRFLF